MATNHRVVRGSVANVSLVAPLEIEFLTRDADPERSAILVFDRRRVVDAMAMELNDVVIANGVKRNRTNDFHGQTSVVPAGTLHTGDETNVLKIQAPHLFAGGQIDNIVLFYATK